MLPRSAHDAADGNGHAHASCQAASCGCDWQRVLLHGRHDSLLCFFFCLLMISISSRLLLGLETAIGKFCIVNNVCAVLAFMHAQARSRTLRRSGHARPRSNHMRRTRPGCSPTSYTSTRANRGKSRPADSRSTTHRARPRPRVCTCKTL